MSGALQLIEPNLAKPDAAMFRFFPCTGPLSYFVEYYYTADLLGHFTTEVEAARLPEFEAKLVFAIEEGNTLPGGTPLGGGLRACLFVQPAHLQVIHIPSSIRQAVGASMRPSGLRLLLPRGAHALADAPLIGLDELWGAEALELRDRLVHEATASARLNRLQRHLHSRAQRLDRPSRFAQRTFELIDAAHGEISTEQLARACGCTSRTLRNSTVAEAGLAPKQLARIARIRYALDLLTSSGVPLTTAAAASAYADYAHMSREFRELIGEPPSRLGLKIRSPALPYFVAERDLLSTGLLVLPKSAL
ncbi:MAG TPA: helix-turn-helix domain-containing protein [Polyangiaceae bacterium]|nr:helix-turn-helix domain-containing protein [Polyangiaceae bacterium]